MGKFKKGVRVRLTEEHDGGGPEVGALGTIYAKGPDKGDRDVIWDDLDGAHDGEANDGSTNHWYVPKSKLEVVVDEPTNEQWVPKVGDRVLHKNTGESVDVRDVSGSILVEFDTPTSYTHNAYGDYKDLLQRERCAFFVDADDLEPLPAAAEAQPAGLTIEAGKFYRTRDGRKVGPMEDREWEDGYPWSASNEVGYYSDSGERQEGLSADDDLVAEWVDEPVSPATQPANDNVSVHTLTLTLNSEPLADAFRTIAAALNQAADSIGKAA